MDAAGAAVTLRDADITGLGNKELAGITLLGDANVLIEGTNAVKGGCEDYPGILVPENHTLTIDGGGSLDVFSKGSSAIGGIYNFDTPGGSGNIVIKGSTITAVGGAYCALFGFILWLAGKTYLNAHPAHVYLEYNYYFSLLLNLLYYLNYKYHFYEF